MVTGPDRGRPLWLYVAGGQPYRAHELPPSLAAGVAWWCYEGDRVWRPIGELEGATYGGGDERGAGRARPAAVRGEALPLATR